MAKWTIDKMAAEMEAIAKAMNEANEGSRDQVLARMDALALRSAQLTGQKAEELKTRLDVIATRFETASADRFQSLSSELHDSVVDILGNIQELKAGQNRIIANQDTWGNSIMDGIRGLGNRIGSYVSTIVIVIEAIISIIAGVIAGAWIKIGATKVVEQIYDKNLTPIGAVPKFSQFEVWGFTLTAGILVATVLFMIIYGITVLINRRRQATP